MKSCISSNMGIYTRISTNKIIFIREHLSKFSEELLTTLHAVCKTLIYSKFNFDIQLDLRVL